MTDWNDGFMFNHLMTAASIPHEHATVNVQGRASDIAGRR